MGIDIKHWAEKFVAELTVGGERVPFERVLAHHLDEVANLRSTSGLTWRSIAALLTRAGARRADGGVISADQLRVGCARLLRHAEEAVHKPANAPSKRARPQRAREPVDPPLARPSPTKPLPAQTGNRAPPQPGGSQSDPDRDEVSDDEIALALARLTKLPPKH